MTSLLAVENSVWDISNYESRKTWSIKAVLKTINPTSQLLFFFLFFLFRCLRFKCKGRTTPLFLKWDKGSFNVLFSNVFLSSSGVLEPEWYSLSKNMQHIVFLSSGFDCSVLLGESCEWNNLSTLNRQVVLIGCIVMWFCVCLYGSVLGFYKLKWVGWTCWGAFSCRF